MPTGPSSGNRPPPAALTAGERLGPYLVEAPLGAGGMGEVWRGRDTRIDRTVAIKVLPRDQAVTAEAEERFEREARAIGQLQHPNVCTLFDVGSHDGRRYIVFEHLEGESLATRLTRGPLPMVQIVAIGSAIAEALAAAHAAGILHRDLKPGNVMLTKAGTKLLDFGLARFTGAEPPGLSPSGSSAMTWATGITAEGTLVGTLSYMAPEQLEGRSVDERADLWALGCVLHEMACGKKAFEGESAAGVIASVLRREPEPLTALAPGTPPALERLVLACLQKSPDERWRSAADLRRELGWIATSGPVAGLPAPGRRTRFAVLAAAAAAVFAGALAVSLFSKSRGSASPPRAVHSVLPFRARLSDPFIKVPQISPDGRQVVVGSTTSYFAEPLWLLALDAQEPRALAGTEGGTFPFWSPDGRSLGFFVDKRLMRIDLEGGSVRTLCSMDDDPRGGAWSSNGVILFSPGRKGGLQRVSAEGGAPVAASKLDGSRGEVTHRWPQFLGGGERFLYWASGNDDKLYLKDSIRLSSLGSEGAGKVILEGVTNAVWTAGHLVYRSYQKSGARGLVAQRFDEERETVSGDAFPLTAALTDGGGASLLRVSGTANGDLVFLGAPSTWSTEMAWLDRKGTHVSTLGEPAPWSAPRVSPDGRRVALARTDLQTGRSSVWVMGADGSGRLRLTLEDMGAGVPAWSPDGKRIAYVGYHETDAAIYVRPANGGPADLLVSMNGLDSNTLDWSPDASRIAFSRWNAPAGNYDLWCVDIASKKATPLLETPADEQDPLFSPDGRQLAYTSRQAGAREEVYLWRLGGETRWQVSEGGGLFPRWRRDGKELFFVGRDARLRSVAVGSDPGGAPGTPRVVSERRLTLSQWFSYDVAPDGSRFIVDMPSPDALDVSVRLLQNWPALVPKAR